MSSYMVPKGRWIGNQESQCLHMSLPCPLVTLISPTFRWQAYPDGVPSEWRVPATSTLGQQLPWPWTILSLFSLLLPLLGCLPPDPCLNFTPLSGSSSTPARVLQSLPHHWLPSQHCQRWVLPPASQVPGHENCSCQGRPGRWGRQAAVVLSGCLGRWCP
jgi:hypothetical protein